MHDPLTAVISFFALGATLLGAAVLLLFDPGSRGVRWFTLFNLGLMGWLLGQGMHGYHGPNAVWDSVHAVSVMLLPAFFVAFALVDEAGRPNRDGLLVVGAAVLLLPILLPGLFRLGFAAPTYNPALSVAWQVIGWIAGAAIVSPFRPGRRRKPRADLAWSHLAIMVALAAVPLTIAAALVLGGVAYLHQVLPLVVVVVQFLLFMGVVRHRFWDIEVRAARTGELATRAAESSRVALMGEVAAAIAHEVRNPLTGVRSLAQRLADDEVDGERRRRYARIILDEVGRVEGLVTQLLGTARRLRPPPVPTGPAPLAELFKDLVLLTSARARQSDVTVTASAGDLSVPGEAREPLAQALLNLLLNAIAHSPPSGRVDLTAHSVGDDVAITVRDRGPGIPASDRDRIFEPFHTGTRDGTGLGLSVVRGLCREQGWQLGVEDAPGGGAVFRVGMRSSAGGASSAGAGGAGDASPRGRISDAPTQPATTD